MEQENEYSHLEHLVNDVTSLDTARMTLRWALERLHTLEKNNADLKRDFKLAQDSREQLEQKIRSIQDSVESRSKILGEQEGFYKKMEATLELLSGGKIDVAALMRKEAQLEQLRKELAEEYQNRFEALDRTQRETVQRWNQRLLDVENHFAQRLSESQTRYDSLRQTLEKEYETRVGKLEESFRAKEKELLERVGALEADTKSHDKTLGDRQTALESEYSAKKTGLEQNYQKLKTMLETNLDARVRSMEGEYSRRLKSIEETWEAERARLLEEQNMREYQFRVAQEKIKELEESLAQQQARHHSELVARIQEREASFREKIKQLEEERSIQETSLKKLSEQVVERERELASAKERLNVEFSQRAVQAEAAAEKRRFELENDFSERKSVLEARYQKLRQDAAAESEEKTNSFKQELLSRTETQEKAWHAEKLRLESAFSDARKDFEIAQSQLARTEEKVKQLENELAGRASGHHAELLELKHAHVRVLKEKVNEEISRQKAIFAENFKAAEAEIGNLQKALSEKEETVRALNDRFSLAESQWSEKFRSLEHDVLAKKADELEAQFLDHKTRLEEGFKRKEEELARRMEALDRQETELKTGGEELRVKYEGMFHQRVVEHEADVKALREGFEKERQQLRTEIAERDASIRDIGSRIEFLEQEGAKERAEFNSRTEAMRSELESAHEERVKQLSAEIQLKDSEISRVKDEASSRDAKWAEAFRTFEHDVVTKKVAQLEAEYHERGVRLENEFLARRTDIEDELRRIKAGVEAAVAERCAGMEEEYSARKAELEARQQKVREELKLQYEARIEAYNRELLGKQESLEKVWNAEKARLEAEMSGLAREAESAGAELERSADKIKEMEKSLLEKQSSGRQELARFKQEAEDYYRGRLDDEVAARTIRISGELKRAVEKAAEFEMKIKELERSHGSFEAELERQKLELEAVNRKEINRLLSEVYSKDAEISRLQEEKMRQEASWADKLSAFETDVLGRKTAQLESEHRERRAELEKEFQAKQSVMETDFKKAKTEAYNRLQEELRNFEADSSERRIIMEQSWTMQKNRLEEEIRYRETDVVRLQEKVKELETALVNKTQEGTKDLIEKLAVCEFNYGEGMRSLEEHRRRLEEEWVVRRQQLDSDYQRLKDDLYGKVQAQIQALESDRAEREKLIEQAGEAQRSRITEELRRREQQLEQSSARTAELENAFAAYRQESSAALVQRITEQEAVHKKLIEQIQQQQSQLEEAAMKRSAELEREYVLRLSQMEKSVESKRKTVEEKEKALERERDDLFAGAEQRRIALDNLEQTLNSRLKDLEESVAAREKQWQEKEEELRSREHEWNGQRRVLQTSYEEKLAQVEKLRDELNRAILDYRKKK